ncbi:MAG TPA: aldolase/citrate lyase family protein, partial [bacterium]|nr:aldolase/citrate lyase family protein [bacterium]
KYCQIDIQAYVQMANGERFVMAQVEDPEILSELEDIAKLNGIDIVFFGPGDFSQGVGAPGDFNHPKVIETREKVATVCKQYGKFCSTPCSLQQMEEYIKMGYNFLNLGADVIGLGQYWKDLMNQARKILSRSI